MSPWEHATGERAGSKHSWQEANGRKESRVRRAEVEFHAALACSLSYEVKTEREVFLLPFGEVRSMCHVRRRVSKLTMRHIESAEWNVLSVSNIMCDF